MLTEEQVKRYARHILLPEIGENGQRRLLEGSVLVVGAGGLGSPAAMYLAAAGVGRLGIADFDVVDATNLQRQIVHDTADVGRSKVESALERLAAINPGIEIIGHPERITSANAFEVIRGFDVVVDGTDTFPTRYLLNDATQLSGLPLVSGSILGFEGQVTTFLAGPGSPCYRCLFPEPPPAGSVPSCEEAGVVGVLPGVIGSLQALESIKLLTGAGDPLVGRILAFDALGSRFREVKTARDTGCAVCGDDPTVTSLIDYEAFCAGRASRSPA
ncbi:MAG TPA: molybdopterin-synthase adenylyltransferase MoeB [Actinomycetota bacterium]|nr:molybdopterin-synthase adenylyltransferase MoeB [Actinomycetota bacterium]